MVHEAFCLRVVPLADRYSLLLFYSKMSLTSCIEFLRQQIAKLEHDLQFAPNKKWRERIEEEILYWKRLLTEIVG